MGQHLQRQPLGETAMETRTYHSEKSLPATPERLWEALTRTGFTSFHLDPLDGGETGVGARVTYCDSDRSELAVGEIVDAERPKRLVMVLEPHGESEGYVQLTVTIDPEDEGSRLSVIGEPFFGDGLDGFDEYVDIPSIADSVRAELERDLAYDLATEGDALDLDLLASDMEADAEGNGVAGATETVEAEPTSESTDSEGESQGDDAGAEPVVSDEPVAEESPTDGEADASPEMTDEGDGAESESATAEESIEMAGEPAAELEPSAADPDAATEMETEVTGDPVMATADAADDSAADQATVVASEATQ